MKRHHHQIYVRTEIKSDLQLFPDPNYKGPESDAEATQKSICSSIVESSILKSPFSLTFEFLSSRANFPNSLTHSKITILNVLDYEWFRRNGQCKTTTASILFSIIDVRQSGRVFLVGIHFRRYSEAIRFLAYFREWDSIMARLTQYIDATQRNEQVSIVISPSPSNAASVSEPASTSSNSPDDNPGAATMSPKSNDSTDSRDDDAFVPSTEPPQFRTPLPPPRVPNTERHNSSPPSNQNTDDRPIHETGIPPTLTPAIHPQTSVSQIETRFLQAAPRNHDRQRWKMVSDDECYYESERITYLRFRPTNLKLGSDRKLCHWGCLDAEGGPTILSSGSYALLFVLTDNRVQERHMSRHRSKTPCDRLPPFLNVTTRSEYLQLRSIDEVIEVLYNWTHEGESAANGRLSALGAIGRALRWKWSSLH